MSDSGGESIERRLRQWYEEPLGRALLNAEQEQLESVLPTLFGYHLVQLGALGKDPLCGSRILHQAVMAVGRNPEHPQAAFCAESECLPLSGDTLDALVLYHTLEFATDPHLVLREVERTLVPEGHVVILGFNPYSLWGLRRLMRARRVPWCGRFVGLPRLKDWLRLLGFDIVSTRQLFFRPPVQRGGVLERLRFLEYWGERWWPFMGGVYMLVGRKKVSTLTPIKPRWRPRRSLVSGLADPASRSGSSGWLSNFNDAAGPRA